jgi:hypothetical protein
MNKNIDIEESRCPGPPRIRGIVDHERRRVRKRPSPRLKDDAAPSAWQVIFDTMVWELRLDHAVAMNGSGFADMAHVHDPLRCARTDNLLSTGYYVHVREWYPLLAVGMGAS